MDWEKKRFEFASEAARKLIRDKQWPSGTVTRIEALFKKLAGLDDGKGWGRTWDVFGRALKHISNVNDALTLFEKEKLDRLLLRVAATEYLTTPLYVLFHLPNVTGDFLTRPYNPLYSLQELGDITEAFISYLHNNKSSVVDTGKPARPFDRSGWFYRNLAYLYPPSDKIDPESMERIKPKRGILFDIKVSILEELRQFAKYPNDDQLIQKCLKKIGLTFDEVHFYLRINKQYVGRDISTMDYVTSLHGMTPGGLRDLLEAVGHFQKEARIGTMDKTRAALGDLIEVDGFKTPHITVEGYFDAVAQGQKIILDKAITVLVQNDKKEKQFLVAYRATIKKELEKRFRKKMPIELEVLPEFESAFRLHIMGYAQQVAAQLETDGKLPPLLPANPRKTESRKTGIFSNSNDYSSVTLRKKTFTLSRRQADVVRILHREYMNGTPEMHQQSIFAEIYGRNDDDEKSGKASIRDIFKRMKGWEQLIVSPRKGIYRLNF
ncbi:hypothetical protein HY522_06745 [bacterium]|nr:hypothetical protein [bacterium]